MLGVCQWKWLRTIMLKNCRCLFYQRHFWMTQIKAKLAVYMYFYVNWEYLRVCTYNYQFKKKKSFYFDVGFYLTILMNEMLTIFLSSGTVGSWFWMARDTCLVIWIMQWPLASLVFNWKWSLYEHFNNTQTKFVSKPKQGSYLQSLLEMTHIVINCLSIITRLFFFFCFKKVNQINCGALQSTWRSTGGKKTKTESTFLPK